MNEKGYTLNQLANDLELEILYQPSDEETYITNANVNRPGLPLAGYFTHFEPGRIQIIGNPEEDFLVNLPENQKELRVSEFLRRHPKAIIYSRSLVPCPTMVRLCEKYRVPLCISKETTSHFMARLISKLNVVLAPMITRHGVLCEVYGIGTLIVGDSGIGKSETAIELVKRGHRLVADDAVELRRVSDTTILGTAPEVIRHYVELRGIGIIDVRRIFGTGAVKTTEKIELVINLEHWQEGKNYDRMGLNTEYTDIMGIKIPSNTIPVHPGRNLAVIIEIAAINARQKQMGYNTAEEFNKQLMAASGISDELANAATMELRENENK